MKKSPEFKCLYSIAMKFLYRNDEMIVLVFCTLIGGSFWMLLALLLSGAYSAEVEHPFREKMNTLSP